MKQRQEMEQKKNSNNNNMGKEEKYLGVAIHSQVRKIRQEMEKINQPSVDQPEPRQVVLRQITGQRRSRSPLGIVQRPISVGNS
ncbi:hypothetical protein LguiA_000710 [Lonicera macranthoides]